MSKNVNESPVEATPPMTSEEICKYVALIEEKIQAHHTKIDWYKMTEKDIRILLTILGIGPIASKIDKKEPPPKEQATPLDVDLLSILGISTIASKIDKKEPPPKEQATPLDIDPAHNTTVENLHTIIKLDVGGRSFKTTRQTLLNVTGSWFHLAFGGGGLKKLPKMQDDGSYFIDASPTIFPSILNYLRTLNPSCIGYRNTLLNWTMLRQEARYFCLDELIKYIEESAGKCQHCKICILDATRDNKSCLSAHATRNHLRVGSIIESIRRPHQAFRIAKIVQAKVGMLNYFKCIESTVPEQKEEEEEEDRIQIQNKTNTTINTETKDDNDDNKDIEDEEGDESNDDDINKGTNCDAEPVRMPVRIFKRDIRRIVRCGYPHCDMGAQPESICPGKHKWTTLRRPVNRMKSDGIISFGTA